MGKLRFVSAAAAMLMVLGLGFVGRATSTGVDLSRNSGVASFLKAHGWEPGQFVIQRGLRNYAGPHCPGAGWNCTTSLKVVQVGKVTNAAECQTEDSCKVTQAPADATTDNTFVCNQNDSGPKSGSTSSLLCDITQVSGSGNNTVQIHQVVNQDDGSTQAATQTANVSQTSRSGANVADVQQIVHQGINTDSPTQSQTATQMANFVQTSNSGTNRITLSQNLKQDEKTHFDGGTQNQRGRSPHGLHGSIQQTSAGLSTFAVDQDARQKMDGTPTTTQTQDPDEFCCANQSGNPGDTGSINQVSVQDQMPHQNQSAFLEADCVTDGNCTANQSATENGVTTTNSASAPSVFITIECSADGCFAGTGDGEIFGLG